MDRAEKEASPARLSFEAIKGQHEFPRVGAFGFLIKFSKMEADVYKRLEILGKDF